MRKFLFGCAVCLCLGSSCGETVVFSEPDRGFEYFPLEVGSEWEYRVDSIIFDDGGSPNVQDTFTSFVRERVIGMLPDLVGDTVYQIERSYRQTPDVPWITTDIWTSFRDFFRVTRIEENLRHVKIEFPLTDTSEWDPLLFISSDTEVRIGTELIEMYTNWHGRVIDLNHPETIGTLMFPDVMTCLQTDDDNEIERRYVFEQYARGVGLIMRVDTILDSYCKRIGEIGPCLGLSWSEKGEKGYILKQQLINYK